MADVIKICFAFYIISSISLIQQTFAEECSFNPCYNGGSCTLSEEKYHCECPHSYTGAVCENFVAEPTTPAVTTTTTTTTTENHLPHECLFSPCLHGGFCVQTGDNYDCFCPSNYAGVLCDTLTGSLADMRPEHLPAKCPFNPCSNGGFCVIDHQHYKCFCPKSFTGKVCDIPVVTTTETPASTTPQPQSIPPVVSIIPSVEIATTKNPEVVRTTSESVVVNPNKGDGNSSASSTISPVDVVTPVVEQPSGEGACRIDLEFLLDASGSVQKKNFKTQLNFTEALVRSLKANNNDVRVGLATFSYQVDNMFYMYDNTTDEIIASIRQVPYISGNTHTELALEFASQHAFSIEHGGRPNVNDVVLIITDGTSKDPAATKMAAQKLHQAGTVVVAVGVGDFLDLAELTLIASDPSHVFTVSDYDALRNVEADLLKASCAASLM